MCIDFYAIRRRSDTSRLAIIRRISGRADGRGAGEVFYEPPRIVAECRFQSTIDLIFCRVAVANELTADQSAVDDDRIGGTSRQRIL